MADVLNLSILVCTSAAALAFGVVAAYWVLRTGFALIDPQRRSEPLAVEPKVLRAQ